VARIMAGVAVGAGGGLLGHPFEASDSCEGRGRMMGCATFGRSGSIRTRDLAADGGHDLHDPWPSEVLLRCHAADRVGGRKPRTWWSRNA
jgi:hypothetical protein